MGTPHFTPEWRAKGNVLGTLGRPVAGHSFQTYRVSGEVLEIKRWKEHSGILPCRASLPSEGVRTLPHEQRTPTYKENWAVFPNKGSGFLKLCWDCISKEHSWAETWWERCGPWSPETPRAAAQPGASSAFRVGLCKGEKPLVAAAGRPGLGRGRWDTGAAGPADISWAPPLYLALGPTVPHRWVLTLTLTPLSVKPGGPAHPSLQDFPDLGASQVALA